MDKPVRHPLHFSRRRFVQTGVVLATALSALSIRRAEAAPASSGPGSDVTPLNAGWSFRGPIDTGNPDNWSNVDLPHSVATLSWRNWNPDAWEHGWQYATTFDLPAGQSGQRYFLHFAGALTGSTPTINGTQLDQHLGGYLPFDYEITQHVKPTGNQLSIELDGGFDLDVPPDRPGQASTSVDFWQLAGLYRGVSLHTVPSVFLADVFAKPINVLDPATRQVDVQCTVDAAASVGGITVDLRLCDGDQQIAATSVPATVNQAGTVTVTGTLGGLNDIQLWAPDSPKLYQVVATLRVDGRPIHDHTVRIGFREARFESSGFYLNGQRLQLRGLNRHQFFPYVGGAMPPRVQRKDVEILRQDLNCNIVRCSHYPQDPSFLDACDELGLLVWEEAPGWGYLGDQTWLDRSYQNIHDMIVRDRNRPSVVVWGVRLNETVNNTAFYTRTQQLSSTLDDSRQTCGAMVGSLHDTDDFQQDVFGYNDYTSQVAADGTREPDLAAPRTDRPYLVSEAIGTLSGPSEYYRRTDSAVIQQGQAIAHARVHDLAGSDPRYCGLLAWCGYDYPSGNGNVYEGVKWPGVITVFRVPKPGAAIYQSQVDPADRLVIQPAFYWDFLDDWSVTTLGQTALICSNADRLEVFVGGSHFASLLPARETYPNLPYPPFIADFHAVDGSPLPELRIDAYVGATRAGSRTFSSDRSRDRFTVAADDESLTADGSDSTRVEFQVVDAYGAPRPSQTGNVTLSLSGPATLIGDNPFPLNDTGGVGAVWVRSQRGRTGEVVVRATHDTLGSGQVVITIQPE